MAKIAPHIQDDDFSDSAYVCGKSAGMIPERPLSMGERLNGASYLDIDAEKKLVDEKIQELEAVNASPTEIKFAMKELGTQRAKEHGWPNAYVFTKAMGEMIIEQSKDKMEVVILRPTIIPSTYSERFPGWIEGVRTLDSLLVAYGRGKLKRYIGNPETIIDLIPCDMVVNSVLVAIATHAKQSRDHHIYQVASSLRNPLKFGDVLIFMHSYFAENPWIGDGGKSVKVGDPVVFNSMAKFRKYMATYYMPFLTILNFVNIIFCRRFEVPYINFKRKINSIFRLTEIYEPYVFFQGIFHDGNTEKLRIIAKQSDLENVDFDPKCIEWEDYFNNTHFPTVVKYLF